jgi:NAD(P)-dependent dehydrogenase (short-subunit alcohol dehydrogenase family)
MNDPRDAGRKPPHPPQEQSATGRESEMDPPPDYGEASYRGHDRLRDRVALITGGDSGIGRAVALAFAREGADVAIAYLENHADAEETAAAVERSGRRASRVACDIGDDSACRQLVEKVVKQFGRIDILVNNAAYQGKAVERSEDLDAERIERTFRTNIVAMFNLVRHALPHMREGSTIINVASIQAYQPTPAILDYATTKGAIVTFTKGLAQDPGVLERGLRVNAVAPGPIWTPLIPSTMPAEKAAKFGENTPLGRAGQPAELAPIYVFLASQESSYITGEVIGVTGGRPLG